MGAECLSYLKSIETHARAFSRLISDGISGVSNLQLHPQIYLRAVQTLRTKMFGTGGLFV